MAIKQISLILAAVLSTSYLSLPAYADEASGDETIAYAMEMAPAVQAPDAVKLESDGSVTAVSASGTVVELPKTLADPVILNTGQTEITIEMPGEVKSTTTDSDGNRFYEGVAPATDLVLQPTESGVRALIHIQDASAPTEFEFPIEVPEGARLEFSGTGGVVLLSESDEVIALVDTPWAKDAEGNEVSTHFEIRDDKLIQHVEHVGIVAYPIVADPLVLAAPFLVVAARWVGGRLVRAVVTSYAVKKTLQARGYKCTGWAPWYTCSIPVR